MRWQCSTAYKRGVEMRWWGCRLHCAAHCISLLYTFSEFICCSTTRQRAALPASFWEDILLPLLYGVCFIRGTVYIYMLKSDFYLRKINKNITGVFFIKLNGYIRNYVVFSSFPIRIFFISNDNFFSPINNKENMFHFKILINIYKNSRNMYAS